MRPLKSVPLISLATCAPNLMLSGAKNNVFGVQIGVATSFAGERRMQKGYRNFPRAAGGVRQGGGQRFAGNQEHVIDLIGRVTRVSVETMAIVAAMSAAKR